jgi:hypothetical protein
MKRRRPAPLGPARTDAAPVRTGEHCPKSGWWYPLQSEFATTPIPARFIGEGSVLPALEGTPVLWLLRGYGGKELPSGTRSLKTTGT